MKNPRGLYDPAYEHDACGVGVVANLNGEKSYDIIRNAIRVLVNLEHRGACGCDPHTGDGAGLLFQLPHAFFKRQCRLGGISLPDAGQYAVGMVFLPRKAEHRRWCERAIEKTVWEEDQVFLGWRDVPVDFTQAGELATQVSPMIRQFFIGAGVLAADQDQFERKLYVVRKVIENAVDARLPEEDRDDFYIASLSSKTIVYKGLLRADQLDSFYRDLSDESIVTSLALVHSRYSTNTLGSWRLAHPYRLLCHNGEINTIRGNQNWMRAREALFASPAVWRRHGQAEPDHPGGRQRHGRVRQRARTAGVHGTVAAPRPHDDDPGSLGEPRVHVGREEGLLRISRLSHGTVGRSGPHRRVRRRPDLHHAGPQRTAALPVRGDEG